MAPEFFDTTILILRAYTRTGMSADDMLLSSVESFPTKPRITKRIRYVPVAYSELMDVEKSSLFVIDFNGKKCHVIREWKLVFDGILTDLPIVPGCVSYEVRSALQMSGEPL